MNWQISEDKWSIFRYFVFILLKTFFWQKRHKIPEPNWRSRSYNPYASKYHHQIRIKCCCIWQQKSSHKLVKQSINIIRYINDIWHGCQCRNRQHSNTNWTSKYLNSFFLWKFPPKLIRLQLRPLSMGPDHVSSSISR